VGSALADRLIAAGEAEAISEVHGSRWGQGWRLSAGIRRSHGGAIVLNVDAADIADLQQQASPDHLLEDITGGAREVAYVILVDGTSRSAYGRLADAAMAAPEGSNSASEALPLARRIAGLTAYELQLADTPVLEFGGPVDPSRQGGPFLRLGLSLEGLRSAERRALTRVLVSVPATLGLGGLVLAFLTLRREHGALREEHARAQEALRRRDRLAAMGELASTVAHEVRNPLNAIGMSVQRLRREFTDAAPGLPPDARTEQEELLDVLGSETRRIDRIVQQFLEFARPPRLAPREVDVASLLNEVRLGAEAFAQARNVGLDAAADGAGTAWVDPEQMKQALDNLVRNAIEASPAGGDVAIRAARDDRGHRIVVADSGPGIAPEHLSKIFDLYFTTKADGTGVGLAVTHQIIDAHGGTIEVDSAPGRGTRIVVALPLRAREAAHA
jgi:signal transduction histidine kinase